MRKVSCLFAGTQKESKGKYKFSKTTFTNIHETPSSVISAILQE